MADIVGQLMWKYYRLKNRMWIWRFHKRLRREIKKKYEEIALTA